MIIEIEVKEGFLQQLGIKKAREILQNRMDAEEFRVAAEHVYQAMDEATKEGVDWENEFEQARQQSWEEYQTKRPQT